jgi:hypothetical protein
MAGAPRAACAGIDSRESAGKMTLVAFAAKVERRRDKENRVRRFVGRPKSLERADQNAD